jgi:hypothetical protein
MYSHYCFDGTVHDDRCKCNCPSCSAHEKTIIQDEFNRRLSENIRKTQEDLFTLVIKDYNAREVLIKELKKQYSKIEEPRPPTKRGIISRIFSKIRGNI